MSAPPSRSRGSTRSRGSVRGGGRLRETGNRMNGIPLGPRTSLHAASKPNLQRQLKDAPRSNQSRGRSTRKDATSRPAAPKLARSAPRVDMEDWRISVTDYNASYKSKMADLYQTLKANREIERKEAIRNGFLADPDKPTSLANAITPVGTCEDMCPQFERVERIVQLMVDNNEKETAQSGARVPCEALMVKRFRRSAAGYDEQLPSDIRPPEVLKRTLDYLINDVVGGSDSLTTVHKFVWDRTRGIRNDFSIQQVTKTEDLRIAIDCFERIARFHILSLHQLSRTDLKDNEFDHHQEREQLNNTLLSLMYYYDDSRQKLNSPNEAEFRAYCIVFEIQDQRPDLEDRMQSWPRPILKDRRVQTALKLYAAAGNTMDEQGPLRPRTAFSLAQSNAHGFWSLVQSQSVSYLMACVAEVYFNLVRASALEVIWKAYRVKRGGSSKVEDWTLHNMTFALGFDEDEQTAQFCEEHEFTIAELEGGQSFIDLGSVAGTSVRDTNPRRKQIFSKTFVEAKRLSRTLPAIIDGLTASQSHEQGFVEELSDAEDVTDGNEESLFLEDEVTGAAKDQNSKTANPPAPNINGASNPFQAATGFGKPSSGSIFPQNDTQVPKEQDPTSRPASNDQVSPGIFSNPFPSLNPAPFNPFQKSTMAPLNESNVSKQKASEEQDRGTMPSGNFPAPSNDIPQAQSVFNPFSPTVSQPGSNIEKKPQEAKSIFPTPTSMSSKGPDLRLDANAAASSGSLQKPMGSNGTAFAGFPSSFPATSGESAQTTTASTMNGSKGLFEPVQQSFVATPSSASTVGQNNEQRQDAAASAIPSKPFTFSAPPQAPIDGVKSTTAGAPMFPGLSSEPFKFASPPSASSPPMAQPVQQQSVQNTSATPVAFAQSSSFPSSSISPQAPMTTPSLFPNSSSLIGHHAKPPQSAAKESNKSTPIATSSSSPAVSKPAPDLRPEALDKLSNIMMTGDGGLLQQFVEYSIGPIIQAAISQDREEKSWARANKYRTIILAKKYVARWRRVSWNLGLQRRARERRHNMARSLRKAAVNAEPTVPHVPSNLSSAKGEYEHAQTFSASGAANMPPPSLKAASKRQSMPTRLIEEGRSLLKSMSSAGSKRKRGEEEVISASNPAPNSTPHSQHRRSRTLATSTISAPPLRHGQTPSRTSIDSSRIGDGSLLGDTLLRQARRLAQGTKLDTTKTDYFTLKAMGVDPDTSIVPEHHKRSRQSPGAVSTTQARNPSATSLYPKDSLGEGKGKAHATDEKKNVAGDDNDDDAALFASIRAVRQTLAESADWFQNNRQSLERSMTPKTDASPPRPETAAERRLREIRERGHTPTRSEIRQRAMKYPFFQPNGTREHSKQEEAAYCNGALPSQSPNSTASPTVKRGFAALARNPKVNGLGGGVEDGLGSRESPSGTKGDSAEDAIEL